MCHCHRPLSYEHFDDKTKSKKEPHAQELIETRSFLVASIQAHVAANLVVDGSEKPAFLNMCTGNLVKTSKLIYLMELLEPKSTY